uniref:Methyltransferase n=1 Tax=Endomicrobium trichonymphae TaxID=1408204 RepID=A0A1C9ZYN5_ENDTX|nr:modification methylase [Candidatus Endomicrobium trichonymphae]
MKLEKYKVYNKSCYGLQEIENNSIDALITDPPYGISYQDNYWDKDLPNKEIWKNSFNVLKDGSFGLIFSSIRLMHRLMVNLEDNGFLIKDVLFWSYLNGMPKSRDIALDIDKELNVESKIVGTYDYVQGYKKNGANNYYAVNVKYKKEPKSELGNKYKGCGLALKPSYEPIILIQKPISKNLTVAQNVIKYGVGVLNIENTRIPYANGEKKVGHNPHPKGRVPSNIIRTQEYRDEYDKFFLVPKVRQNAEEFNHHPTLKPVELMEHLVKLVSFENQIILDPFSGSCSTGVASLKNKRKFIGYELDNKYYKICKKRMENIECELSSQFDFEAV